MLLTLRNFCELSFYNCKFDLLFISKIFFNINYLSLIIFIKTRRKRLIGIEFQI